MDKLFIKTLVQHGGDLSNNDKVVILNTISKHINKKMKRLEYEFAIKLKLQPLPTNNWDCIPMTFGMNTMVQVNGNLQGQIPMYANVEVAMPPRPTITPVIRSVPLTPYGFPAIGVPALAVNPFGSANTMDERIARANKYLDIIQQIQTELSADPLDETKVDKKYFDFIDLGDEDEDDAVIKELNDKLGISSSVSGASGYTTL